MHTDRSHITFWIDDVCNDDLGIRVNSFPSFSGAEPRITKYSIPGRNGDLTYWDGSFKNIDAEISCYIADVSKAEFLLTAVNNWMTNCGYRKFVISSEPQRYRMARIKNAADIAIRMGILAPFALELDCKPQRFFSDETPLHFSGGNGAAYNHTGFPSSPLMRCYLTENVSAAGTQYINFGNDTGEYRLLISAGTLSGARWIDVDTELKCAITDTGENLAITTDSTGFPSFCSGKTELSWGNSLTTMDWFASIEVYPRWWTL